MQRGQEILRNNKNNYKENRKLLGFVQKKCTNTKETRNIKNLYSVDIEQYRNNNRDYKSNVVFIKIKYMEKCNIVWSCSEDR